MCLSAVIGLRIKVQIQVGRDKFERSPGLEISLTLMSHIILLMVPVCIPLKRISGQADTKSLKIYTVIKRSCLEFHLPRVLFRIGFTHLWSLLHLSQASNRFSTKTFIVSTLSNRVYLCWKIYNLSNLRNVPLWSVFYIHTVVKWLKYFIYNRRNPDTNPSM